MVIGIIVSTELEAGRVLEKLAEREELSLQRKPFFSGLLKGSVRAAVCICGIGKTNAAHGTALLIEKFRPALVYNIGVAGAYPSSGLRVGDIAVGERDIYGDEGLMLGEAFCTMDVLGFPLASAGGVKYYNEFPLFIPEAVKNFPVKGKFVTVSACTGTSEKGREVEKRFGAICESMEGAAIAHVCALNGIPLTEIRGISNVIEDRTAAPLDVTGIVNASGYVQRFFLERLV